MLYIAPAVAGLAATLTVLIRWSRHLDDEVKAAILEIGKDIGELGRDCFNCFIHTLALYLIMVTMGVAGATAIATAISVGSIRIFTTEHYHPTNYLHRSRERLVRWWMCRR